MSNEKVKLYRNPARELLEVSETYTPEYKKNGIKIEEYKSALIPDEYVSKPLPPSMDNPRLPRAVIRQPYAEAIPSPIGRGKGPVPNIGNNVEHTWSSVDGDIIDDISQELHENYLMVDNNDFVSVKALGIPEDNIQEVLPTLDEVENPPAKQFMTKVELQEEVDKKSLSFKDGNYLLIVGGIEICSGLLEEIQSQVKDLVFGDHYLCNGDPISIDDILVIKKIKINVGVFLE